MLTQYPDSLSTPPQPLLSLDLPREASIIFSPSRLIRRLALPALLLAMHLFAPAPVLAQSPSAPEGLKAFAGENCTTVGNDTCGRLTSVVRLQWNKVSAGNPAVSSYEYQATRVENERALPWSAWRPLNDVKSLTTAHYASISIPAANNDKEHRFRLRAVNSSGKSTAAPQGSPGYVVAYPGRGTGLPPVPAWQDPPAPMPTVTLLRRDGEIVASWPAALRADGYEVRYSADSGTTWQFVASYSKTTVTTIRGLSNGATYIVSVRGVNDYGQSAWIESEPELPIPWVSNLAETDFQNDCTVSGTRGSSVGFTTGNADSSYTLVALVARFKDKVDPNGNLGDITVTLHAANSTSPANPVTSTTLATLSGSNPDTAGDYTYTCTPSATNNCDLDQNTTYHVWMRATAGNASSDYYPWVSTSSNNETGVPADNDWTIANATKVLNATGGVSSTNSNSCKMLVSAAVRPPYPGSRNSSEDFTTLADPGGPDELWSDGTTMWVIDRGGFGSNARIHAYKISDQSRDTSKEFDTLYAAGNQFPRGLWSDGVTMWVSDSHYGKIYAYKMSDQSRDASKDFDTLTAAGNAQPNGLWSDGVTMWVADYIDSKIYAYKMSDKSRDASKDFDTLDAAGNSIPRGLWSDGVTMWVANDDSSSLLNANDKIYAYKMSDKSRDASKDYNTLKAAGNRNPKGIWSDGVTMWVSDPGVWPARIFAYRTTAPKLTVSSVTPTTATLTLIGHVGNWWLKYTTPSGGTCTAGEVDFSHALSALTGGTTYTYTAYSKAECGSADELASVTFNTSTLTAGALSKTGATLTIAGHTGNWWYKRIAPTGDATCHSVTSGTTTLTTLTKGRSYTYTAYSQSDCTSASVLTTVTFTTRGLVASKVGGTSATLTLTGHSGNWWLKQTAPSGGTCTAGEADFSHALSTLTTGTPYTYTAYRNSSCTSVLDSETFTPRYAPGDRRASKDFGTLSAAGNNDPSGLWSDGTTVWVADRADKLVYAYTLTTKARDTSKDFSITAVPSPYGLWSDGTTIWVANISGGGLYAYKMSDKNRDSAKDFTSTTLYWAGNSVPSGLWSDGTTMWVSDFTDGKLYAYKMSDKSRDSAKDFNTLSAAGNTSPAGLWSNGVTMWVGDRADDKLYAYNLATKARDTSKDFETLADAGNNDPRDIWSDGDTMWVTDNIDDKLYAYQAYPTLTASALSKTGATLTLAGYTGGWWYNRAADATCHSVASGTTTLTLTSLTKGTPYTYTAYSQAGCASADEIVSVTFTTHGLVASSLNSTSATLTLIGHSGDWWLKKTAPTPVGTCTAGESDFSHALSTLTTGTTYTYTAYSDSSCTTVIDTVTFTPRYAPEERKAAKDFDTLSAAGNRNATGLWSDGTTMWVADDDDDKLYAYKRSDKSRDTSKDFDTLGAAGNNVPTSIWSDGTTMWVADDSDAKLYAYKLSDKSRDTSKDFDTLSAAGNHDPMGLWSDGTTMWVADYVDDKLYAYKRSDKSRDATKDFNTLTAAGNDNPRGIWSDGTTMWVADYSDDKLYAYKRSDKSRDTSKDFDTLSAAGNNTPRGVWSDGTTVWVADYSDRKLYAYQAYRSLTVSSVTTTTATLTLAGHTGSWWLKQTVPSAGTCTTGESDFSHALSTLTAGRFYTYAAYGATGCHGADELASATFSTLTSGSSNLSLSARSSRLRSRAVITGFPGGAGSTTTALDGNAEWDSAAGLPGYVSNLSSAPSGGTRMEAGDLAAVAFTTGSHPDGYTLNSVTATLGQVSGDANLELTLHDLAGDTYGAGSRPAPTARATLTGTDPTADEFADLTYTCAGSGCALAPNTTYFVVAENAGSGVFSWAFIFSSATLSETTVPTNNGWALGYGHYSADAITWSTFQDWQHTRLDFTPR